MRYLCLVYPPEGFTVTPAVTRNFLALRDAMTAAGVFVAAGQLRPPDTATTVRVRGDSTLLTDGPFAEMKEHVGGYLLLDCADLDDAVRWASQIPGAPEGGVEIRPLVDFPG